MKRKYLSSIQSQEAHVLTYIICVYYIYTYVIRMCNIHLCVRSSLMVIGCITALLPIDRTP